MSPGLASGGSLSPVGIETLFQRAYEQLYADNAQGAADLFRAAATLEPDSGDAWAGFADAIERAGDAAAAYGRAVRIDPVAWTWRLGWADALSRSGAADEAVIVYAGLTQERPDSAAVRLGYARALKAVGQSTLALAEYREAVALRGDDADAALELADGLVEAGDALAAVELLQPMSRRMPDDADLLHGVGRAWIALREPEKALTALRRARGLDPDDRLGSGAAIAALEAGEGADLSAAYVRALFDRYADRFDQDLLGKLGYTAPDILRTALEGVMGPVSGLRILDLGCGTGLAGLGFRSWAATLSGVDLSPRMVDKARERALYDDLRVGDVVAVLEETPAAWDLLVAADVLVYIGDLEPVFRAAAKALVPGGRFAATVERSPDEGFALGPSRRYAHSEAYLRAVVASAGMAVRLLEPCTPRREKGVGVPGLVVVAER